MISIQASVSKGWLNRYGGFVFDSAYFLDPFHRMKQDEACHDFIRDRFPDIPIYNMEDNLVQAGYVVPNMMLVGAIQPNMIIAAALGAEFVFASDKDSDVKGFPLKDINDPSELPSVADTTKLPFIKSLGEQFVEAKNRYPDYRIIPLLLGHLRPGNNPRNCNHFVEIHRTGYINPDDDETGTGEKYS